MLLVVASFVVLPSAASAAECVVPPEYSGGPVVTVSPSGPVQPGQQITITGSGFPPGCEVVISVDGVPAGTATTDGSGNFSLGTTLGTSVAGTVTIGVTAGDFSRTIVLQVAPRGAALTCTPATLTFGDAISCTATGFPASTPVTFQINPTLGTATTDAAGAASISTRLPASSAFENGGCGQQTVTAAGGGTTASTTITVTCPGTPTTGPLPRTGSDSATMAGVALAMVAGGGLLVAGARKRRSAA